MKLLENIFIFNTADAHQSIPKSKKPGNPCGLPGPKKVIPEFSEAQHFITLLHHLIQVFLG
jgi:hypothetical protein